MLGFFLVLLTLPPQVIHTRNGDYRVRYDCELLDHGYDGMTQYKIRVISIACGQEFKEEQDTVLHEAIHAELGLDFARKHIGHEEIVMQVTPAVLDLLKRNPQLRWYLSQQ